MKIVIITNNSNGLYLFRKQLISTLIEKGNEVTALTPFDTDVDNLRELGVSLVETPVDRRGTNPIRDYALLKLYKKELEKINPELVMTYTIKPNIYGGMVCRQLKIPYAANITGLGTAFESTSLLRKIVSILNGIGLKEARVVFFENSKNRDVFVDEGIVNKEKSHVLQGAGVDLKHFSYQPYPYNKVFRFLFIGRVMKEKGIDELLEAMRCLIREGENCTIDILGDYEEDYKEKLEKSEREGWLKYHGNKSDVRPFIFECDCFVLPSYHEGMANTNLECASSGRPIITTNIAGCREAVTNGTGIVCEPKNTEDLYKAMKQMIRSSRVEREQMGKNGRKHMENHFDRTMVIADTINALQQRGVKL